VNAEPAKVTANTTRLALTLGYKFWGTRNRPKRWFHPPDSPFCTKRYETGNIL